MSTITTINSTDLISNSRSDINTNFANLNTDKVETSVIDTDTALAANSDAKIPSQKAVKTYIDTSGGANASETVRGIVEEATDAEVTAGTATGGTGAKLVVTPAKLETRLAARFPYTSGTASKNLNDSNGNQVIAHGLGKTPKRIVLTGHYASDLGATSFVSSTYGTYDGTTNHCAYMGGGSANATAGNSDSFAIRFTASASLDHQDGTVTFDATNITIAWNKTGTPNDSGYFVWEAFG